MQNDKTPKHGLHKEISSIFEGVPLPTDKVSRPLPQEDAAPRSRRPVAANPFTAEVPDPAHQVLQAPQAPQAEAQAAPTLRTRTARAKPLDIPASMIPKQTSPGMLSKLKGKLLKPKPGVSPARQKAMVVLVPILAIGFIFAMTNIFGTSPRTTKADEASEAPLHTAAVAEKLEWILPEPMPAAMIDPMLPRKTENPGLTTQNDQTLQQSQIVVKGILMSDNPAAVVSGKIVHVGDTVIDAKIVKITTGAVHFERDGETWTQAVQR